ncbi:MAG: hypothetical protein WCJ35_05820 [Planctomycetota bacterium]
MLKADGSPIIRDFVPPRAWYAYQEPPESDEVLARRREVETALLRRLFGPAAWDALTPCQRRLVDMLMLELVPGRRGWRRGYGSSVRLIIGSVPGQDQAPIPFWVNGGGLPRSWGHSLLSGTRGSIIVRAGYVRAYASDQERAATMPRLLADLRYVADALHVLVIGRSDYPHAIDMETMIRMASWESGLGRLSVTRIRALPDYAFLREWAKHFADCDKSAPVGDGDAGEEMDAKGLLQRSAALGITLVDLAMVLGTSSSYMCMFKHGHRRWPPGFLPRIKTFLNAAEAAVVGTIRGPWVPLAAPLRLSRAPLGA